MQVEVVKMDPRIARIHYQDYHKKVLEHRKAREAALRERAKEAGKALGLIRIEKTRLEQEDEVLMKAYRELSLGQRIIDIRSVLHKAGVDKGHLPKLAISKANKRRCYFSMEWRQIWGNGAAFYDEDVHVWQPRQRSRCVVLPRDTFPPETWDREWRRGQKLADYPVISTVPTVPPHLRPADLDKYYLLWEVEKWEKATDPPRAPGDPLLLKRVTDHFFTIVAQWDLTPLEQRVMEGSL
jgi:hypothetical protein